MEKKQHSAKFLRQRKFMMVLPLLVLPFLTMVFWALGGGSGTQTAVAIKPGLNLQLPDAQLKDEKQLDKLSFYKEADEDSIRREEILRNDPYYKDSVVNRQQQKLPLPVTYQGLNSSPYSGSVDANEQKIYRKIEELNKQINAPETTALPSRQNNDVQTNLSGDVDRLQNMMQVMNGKRENDPEMQQLNGTLEKILDIQHPDRVKEKLREQSLKNKQRVFSISSQSQEIVETYLGDSTSKPAKNGFYDERNNAKPLSSNEANSVSAVVNETQVLVNSSTVKLRLTSDVFINGLLIPKGSFVFGMASLENERLLITIPNIRYGNNLLPVALSVYDMDGLAGIHIPGSINRDVAKQSADQSLQSVEFMSLDPSLKAQAAAAGVSAAKSLLSKKVKLVKVTVKAGYQVLLKDNNQQNN
ncbi:MAG: conjugative transposon protein TraM [Sediminibacterium sp.]